MKRALLTTLPVLLLLLLFAGCSSSTSATSDATPGSGKGLACAGLATIHGALESLSKVGDKTTVAQAQTLQKSINVALTGLDKVVSGSASTTLNQLKTANDQLGEALAGLPPSDTLGQHGPQLQQFKNQVAQAQATEAQLASKLNCSQ